MRAKPVLFHYIYHSINIDVAEKYIHIYISSGGGGGLCRGRRAVEGLNRIFSLTGKLYNIPSVQEVVTHFI